MKQLSVLLFNRKSTAIEREISLMTDQSKKENRMIGQRTLKTLVIIVALLASPFASASEVVYERIDYSRGTHEEIVEDMSVKVPSPSLAYILLLEMGSWLIITASKSPSLSKSPKPVAQD